MSTNITDEQIIDLYSAGVVGYFVAYGAIYGLPGWGRREAARARIAEILNQRAKESR